MPVMLKSFKELGTPVPNIAYCSSTLFFDRVEVNERKNKPPRVNLLRKQEWYTINVDKATLNWLNPEKLPQNTHGYVTLPAYIAQRMV